MPLSFEIYKLQVKNLKSLVQLTAAVLSDAACCYVAESADESVSASAVPTDSSCSNGNISSQNYDFII